MIDLICGARPNFMKIDPILRNLDSGIKTRLVHTGQHYDHEMSQSFFDELGLPKPDINLEIGSASTTVQTAEIMKSYEKIIQETPPELIVVVGDVNSTLACSLVAVRYSLPVVHVEAGLRSFDRTMPEEINRILTDRLSNLLLITSPEARDNLIAEGCPESCIRMVGNPMIDTLLRLLPEARKKSCSMPETDFGLVTLHRPSNVDDPSRLRKILDAFASMSELEFIFPVHPRTRKNMLVSGVSEEIPENVKIVEPMGYLEFIKHQENSVVVITDSGGIQEETTVLGKPCVTLRKNTERPVTIEKGTNILCPEPGELPTAVAVQISGNPTESVEIPFWDGLAGKRISMEISGFLK